MDGNYLHLGLTTNIDYLVYQHGQNKMQAAPGTSLAPQEGHAGRKRGREEHEAEDAVACRACGGHFQWLERRRFRTADGDAVVTCSHCGVHNPLPTHAGGAASASAEDDADESLPRIPGLVAHTPVAPRLRSRQHDSRPATLMGEELVCAICLGLLCGPHTLPCGHSFCGQCIYQHRAHATIVTAHAGCPSCRAPLPRTPPKLSTQLSNFLDRVRPTLQTQTTSAYEGGEILCCGETMREWATRRLLWDSGAQGAGCPTFATRHANLTPTHVCVRRQSAAARPLAERRRQRGRRRR